MNNNWTTKETRLVEKWFENKSSKRLLFEQIYKVNPHRSFEAICRKIRRMKQEGFVKGADEFKKAFRVGYLDIETTNLNADFGYMLSWAIKPRDKKEVLYSCITRKEVMDKDEHSEGDIDYRVTKELLETLDQFDILWTHWGADRRFDLPYIRTRALMNGILHLLPERDEKFIADTWPISRMKLKLSNNRLQTIADACGVEGCAKTSFERKWWRLGALGNKKAIEYILEHNIQDVLVLEEVHKTLEGLGPKSMATF